MDKKKIILNTPQVELEQTKLKKKLHELVNKFKSEDGWSKSEEHIQTSFTVELLKILGWNSSNWIINTGQEIKTGKKPDIVLKSDTGAKLLVVESKEASSKDKLDGSYGNKKFTDQLFNYCHGEGLSWGVLTNFIEWRLYSVHHGRLYKERKYAFHELLWDNVDKKYYIDLLSEDGLNFLMQLSKSELSRKNGIIDSDPIYYPEQLDLEQDKIKKDFFNKIKDWRASLKKFIAKNYANYEVDKIDLMAQKIIDRMIFIDLCHDKKILSQNYLGSVLESKQLKYEELKNVFCSMDEKFNTELFAHNDADELKISDDIIVKIIKELDEIDFSKLSVHIIGEVYENYLGELLRSNARKEDTIKQKQKSKRKSQGIYYTPAYIVDYIVKNTVGELLKKCKTVEDIEKIKVLDPACGSGSFLIRAFDEFHNAYLEKQKEGGLFGFNIRKKILQKNLYGVDLDPKAIEITKLNLMIKALEGVNPNELKGKHLLPNLNLNIRCGNSLIGGEKLKEKEQNLNLFDDYESEINKLTELKEKFYRSDANEEKKQLLEEINKFETLINGKLNEGLKEYFKNLDKIKPFNYSVAFCEIFKDGGFDAVIGNPPYVRSRNLNENERKFFSKVYKSAFRTFDIYLFFLEKPLDLISAKGFISFIIPYSFLNQPYAMKLRELLLDKSRIAKIIDLTSTKVFQDAQISNCILVYQSNKLKNKKFIDIVKSSVNNFKKIGEINQNNFNSNPDSMFKIELLDDKKDILKKIEIGTLPFSAICYISKGIEVYERGSGKTKNEFILDKPTDKNHKPYLEAKEISRYKIDWKKRYIDYQPKKHCSGKFPELFENNKIIMKRIIGDRGLSCYFDDENFYVENTLICCLLKKDLKNKFEFSKEEIELSEKYELKYLLGILNSKLLSYYFKIKLGDKLQIYNRSLEILPIKTITLDEQGKIYKKIIKLVKEILKLNKNPEAREKNKDKIASLDYEIDKEVYKLYGLNNEDIKIIEGS